LGNSRNFSQNEAFSELGQIETREARHMPLANGKTSLSTPENNEIVELLPALRAFARTFFRDADSADDLVQETLLKGLANVHQFQLGTSMKSWLFTIMRNTFYTQIKINQREMPGSADCVSHKPVHDATQEWSARGRDIAEALQRLPQEQREIIILIGVLGVSYEEASKICGCAMGTIKSRLNRARHRLLRELHEESGASSVQNSDSHPIASMPHRRS
jgi:RNA polymerase sigma factor (sigma-70 family)